VPIAVSNMEKTLPFQQIKHQISTLDAQPSIGGGIVVMVTGALMVRYLSYIRSKRADSLIGRGSRPTYELCSGFSVNARRSNLFCP
jgi:hypothetical protein